MKMLLVIGLLAFIALVVALAVRRGSGGGYRRRFAPMPGGRKPSDAAGDSSTMMWVPAIYPVDSSSHAGSGADCGSGAHSGGDCGASAGADGGGGS